MPRSEDFDFPASYDWRRWWAQKYDNEELPPIRPFREESPAPKSRKEIPAPPKPRIAKPIPRKPQPFLDGYKNEM